MDNKQVIKVLEFSKQFLPKCEEYHEAIDKAVKATEKTIQKKVINSKGWLECPSCGECLNNDYGTKNNFCPYCGQALDWSVDE